jgi:hypothetical protein
VYYPEGWSTRKLREQVRTALAEATKRSYMRPNAVDAIYDKNSGNNLGGDDFPYIHFEEVDANQPLMIELMLKGGGCENVSAQYSLPDERLAAGRAVTVEVERNPRFALDDAVLQGELGAVQRVVHVVVADGEAPRELSVLRAQQQAEVPVVGQGLGQRQLVDGVALVRRLHRLSLGGFRRRCLGFFGNGCNPQHAADGQ